MATATSSSRVTPRQGSMEERDAERVETLGRRTPDQRPTSRRIIRVGCEAKKDAGEGRALSGDAILAAC
mgnify:CR=1 FL=1